MWRERAALAPAGTLAAIAHADATAQAAAARELVARAVAYEHGEGVAKAPQLAVTLYCPAARSGDPTGEPHPKSKERTMTTITPENRDTFDTTYVTVIANQRTTGAVRYATAAELEGIGGRDADIAEEPVQPQPHGRSTRADHAPEADAASRLWLISTEVLGA